MLYPLSYEGGEAQGTSAPISLVAVASSGSCGGRRRSRHRRAPELRGRVKSTVPTRQFRWSPCNFPVVATEREVRSPQRRRAARRLTHFVIRDQLRHSLSDALRAAGLPEPPNGVALEPGDPDRGQGDWASRSRCR